MSLSAALITLTLPRSLGAVCGAAAYAANPAATRIGTAGTQPRRSLLPGCVERPARRGARAVRERHASALVHAHQFRPWSWSWAPSKASVLPVHFTAANSPELLGYVLSAMSAGMLASSLGYAPTSCVAAPGTSYRSPAWPWESWGWAFCRRSRCSSRARSCWVFRPAPSRPCSASSSSTAFPPKIEEAPRHAEFAHPGRRARGRLRHLARRGGRRSVRGRRPFRRLLDASSPCGPSTPTA